LPRERAPSLQLLHASTSSWRDNKQNMPWLANQPGDPAFDTSEPSRNLNTPPSTRNYHGSEPNLTLESIAESMPHGNNHRNHRGAGHGARENGRPPSFRYDDTGGDNGANQSPPTIRSLASPRGQSSSGSNGISDRQSNSSSDGSISQRMPPNATSLLQNQTPPRGHNAGGYGTARSPHGASPVRGAREASRSHFSPQLPKVARQGTQEWAHQQECKVKVANLALVQSETGCWTKEIYEALEEFGNIVKIEIDVQRSGAWVTFQYVALCTFPVMNTD
jgi:hypothetical protein